jgi:dihydropyrimidinase
VFDLVISGGSIVREDAVLRADIALQGGQVVLLADRIDGPCLRRIDAQNLMVLPGLVDPHVHLSLPMKGTLSADDPESGTIAALFGGVTTIGDFTVPGPGQTLLEALDERRRFFASRARTDYWFHVNVTEFSPGFEDDLPRQLDDAAAAGARSLKVFTCYSREGIAVPLSFLPMLLQEARQRDLLVLVHAEDDSMLLESTDRLLEAERTQPRDYPESRPPEVEIRAVESVLSAAAEADAPIYFVHISTAGAATAIVHARRERETARGIAREIACEHSALGEIERQRGGFQPIYLETCPQYLFLDDALYQRPDGAQYLVAPPLRPPSDGQHLRRALIDGQVDVVATDHCPFTRGQKEASGAPFTALPNGLPGIETRLALLYTEMVVPGFITMRDLVRIASANPSRIFGLYPRKGTLIPGSDADLVLFDPQAEWTLTAGNLHMRTDFSPYEGRSMRGRVVSVIRRGEVVIEGGALVSAGPGEYLGRG